MKDYFITKIGLCGSTLSEENKKTRYGNTFLQVLISPTFYARLFRTKVWREVFCTEI
jgi:hypothetical protein